jgi:hypothetical protein
MAFPPVIVEQKLLRAMELQLSDLAALWRGQQDGEARDETVRQYQAILRCMIELGYNDSLVTDSELPEELMPQEYLELF